MADGRTRKGPLAALFGLFAVAVGSFWWGAAPTPPASAPAPQTQPVRTEPAPVADGPPLVLVLRVPDFASAEVRRDGVLTVTGLGDPGTRIALIQNNVAVVEQPTAADGRFSVTAPPLNRPGTFEHRLRAATPDGRSVLSEEMLTVVVPRTTAEAFTATLTGPQGTRELLRVDPTPVTAPRFQQVQVQPNGVASVAGQVDPGARVSFIANGREIGAATANPQGAFAIGPTPPLATGVTRFELRATHPDGRAAPSAERIVVDIPGVPGGAFSAVLEAPGQAPRVIAQTPAANPRMPRFEQAEARPDGGFAIAGTIEPGGRVALLRNGQPVGAPTVAGANGGFAFLSSEALPPGPTEFRLRSTLGDGRTATSEERFVIVRPRTGAEAFEARVEQPGQPPRVVARVEPAPIAPGRLERIEAGDGGVVSVTGRTEPGARVELRSGDTVVADAVARPDGTFSIGPTAPLAPGRHGLRLFSGVADGRTALGPETLVIERPASGDQAFRVAVEEEGSAPRILADRPAGAPLARMLESLPEPPPAPPLLADAVRPAPPAPLAAQPSMPAPVATRPAPPAPVANVPPAPRRTLPARELK